MNKKGLLFFISLIALLSVSIFPKGTYADSLDIYYESDGRVKPIENAQVLSENQLDDVLDAIGIEKTVAESMSIEEKIGLASQGGKALNINKVAERKTFYKSLDGTKIEYTENNEDLIAKKKLDDLNKYNELTGQSLTIADIQSNNGGNQDINTMAALPNNGLQIKTTGDLQVVQQVVYLGSTTTQYRYLYASTARWNKTPFNTKTDILGTAWNADAVATANSFSGNFYQEQEVADGKGGTTWLTENKNLSMADPKSYGHYVKTNLGNGSLQEIHMNREVRVAKDKKGHPAYVLTKYFHTYYNIGGSISASIGPVSVEVSPDWLSAGDETYVEYSYSYGDN